MRILFGVPRGVAQHLSHHSVEESRYRQWDRLANGELIRVAEQAGFDLIVTNDKNIRHQQNLAGRRIAVIALGNSQWPMVLSVIDRAVSAVNAVNAATPGSYADVEISFKS